MERLIKSGADRSFLFGRPVKLLNGRHCSELTQWAIFITNRRIMNTLQFIDQVKARDFIISAKELASLSEKNVLTNAVTGDISRQYCGSFFVQSWKEGNYLVITLVNLVS